jgi:hypothetical protein
VYQTPTCTGKTESLLLRYTNRYIEDWSVFGYTPTNNKMRAQEWNGCRGSCCGPGNSCTTTHAVFGFETLGAQGDRPTDRQQAASFFSFFFYYACVWVTVQQWLCFWYMWCCYKNTTMWTDLIRPTRTRWTCFNNVCRRS